MTSKIPKPELPQMWTPEEVQTFHAVLNGVEKSGICGTPLPFPGNALLSVMFFVWQQGREDIRDVIQQVLEQEDDTQAALVKLAQIW